MRGIFVTKLLKERRTELSAVAWPSVTYVSAVFHIRCQVLSVFAPFLLSFRRWENVEVSTAVERSFDHFSLFELCFGWANPVYHRFLSFRFQGKDFGRIQLLEKSIWRCDETTTTGKQGFWYFARSRSREFQVDPRNPAKFTKTREIPRNSLEILPNTCPHNIFESYLGCWGCLLAGNLLIYLVTSSPQRVNNISNDVKTPAFLA